MKAWSQDQIDNVSAIDIVRFLQCCRLDLSTEKHLQHDIEQALQISCLSFEREKRLSERDIPDFFVKGGIVIECKMRNKSRKISHNILSICIRFLKANGGVSLVPEFITHEVANVT